MTLPEADHLSSEATQFFVAILCSKSNSTCFFDAERAGWITSSDTEKSDAASTRVPRTPEDGEPRGGAKSPTTIKGGNRRPTRHLIELVNIPSRAIADDDEGKEGAEPDVAAAHGDGKPPKMQKTPTPTNNLASTSAHLRRRTLEL